MEAFGKRTISACLSFDGRRVPPPNIYLKFLKTLLVHDHRSKKGAQEWRAAEAMCMDWLDNGTMAGTRGMHSNSDKPQNATKIWRLLIWVIGVPWVASEIHERV